MNKILTRALCALLAVCMLVPTLAAMPVRAEQSSEDESSVVVFNRDFADGWEADNGIDASCLGSHLMELVGEKMSASYYNYSVRLDREGDSLGFAGIATDTLPTEGKVTVQLRLRANPDHVTSSVYATHIGGNSTVGLVRIEEGVIYALGRTMGETDGDWMDMRFVFDLDYGEGTYLCTVYAEGVTYSRVFKHGSDGKGIQAIGFGFNSNSNDLDVSADYLDLDDIAIMSGDRTRSDLASEDYGLAVDATLDKTVEVITGVRDAEGYLSGAPTLDRNGTIDSLIYNRNYSEGWDVSNGVTYHSYTNNRRGNTFTLESDYDCSVNKSSDSYLNYYLRIMAENNSSGFVDIDPLMDGYKTKFFIEYDIKASLMCDVGQAVAVHTYTNKQSQRSIWTLSEITDGQLKILGKNVGNIGNEWVHVSAVIDFDYPSYTEGADEKQVKITVYYGEDGVVEQIGARKDGVLKGIGQIRVGVQATDGEVVTRKGDWYALDNFSFYTADGFCELPADNYGTLVNTELIKDFEVDSGFTEEITVPGIFEQALNMKVGVVNCLNRGEKQYLYLTDGGVATGAPLMDGEDVMIPFEPVLNYVGATNISIGDRARTVYLNGHEILISVDSAYAMVDGVAVTLNHPLEYYEPDGVAILYMALSDVDEIFPGFYPLYDNMGLCTVSTYRDFVTRQTDGGIDAMLAVMKRFIYDYPTAKEIYQRAVENTDNFTHPYIIVNQDKFDELNSSYYALPGDDNFNQDLIEYIDSVIAEADQALADYAIMSEDGLYLGLNPDINPIAYNVKHAGYDSGGRLSQFSDVYAAVLDVVAFAWQMTRNDNYARFAYEWTYLLCQRIHWGPAHFLNTARATWHIALTYDWLYNIWTELGYDLDAIAENIYNKGIFEGWQSINNIMTQYPRNQYYAGLYHHRDNNWNAQCSAGMIIGSLAIMSYPEYREKGLEIIEDNIYCLANYGLQMFAPDGSYPEGPGYWWGTVHYVCTVITTMETVLGDDFGYLDTWGLLGTCYFACQIESSDGLAWNFHDCNLNTTVKTSWFFYLSDRLGDPRIYEIRRMQIEGGKAATYWDVLYFDPAERESTELDLGYYMENLNAYVYRTSWEPGAMFTGIMGGDNSITHGHVDSGNFIYDNAGIRWFTDLGREDYLVYQHSWYYYRRNAEGHNCLVMTDAEELIYGQELESVGKITDYYENEHGAYTIIDNTKVYGDRVVSARRGMLVTNDGKTTVIQDEVSLVRVQTLYWFAHLDYDEIQKIELSQDRLTAIVTAVDDEGEIHTLRVRLVSSVKSFRFSIMQTYDIVLDKTSRPGESEAMGGHAEDDRSNFVKLAIVAENALSFNAAVVIELLDGVGESLDTGYEWCDMDNWMPSADTRDIVEEVHVATRSPQRTAIITGANLMQKYVDDGTAFKENLDAFYKALTDAWHSLEYYKDSNMDSTLTQAAERVREYKALYDAWYAEMVARTTSSSLVGGILGRRS